VLEKQVLLFEMFEGLFKPPPIADGGEEGTLKGALGVKVSKATVCPQLLFALNYCLPASTTVCPQLKERSGSSSWIRAAAIL
jgi:hypothetical protein